MSNDTVLAFCPQPKGLKEYNPVLRARDEEWFALPEDPADWGDIQADQCDNCGANSYHAKTCSQGHVDVVCDSCGWEYVTAWLPENLAVF